MEEEAVIINFQNRYHLAKKTQGIIEEGEFPYDFAYDFCLEKGGFGMLERDYQSRLIKKLKLIFPGCIILKNDTDYQQGIPDLLILWRNKWAMLEVKGVIDAPEQPNQQYWVEELNNMSFAAFISPETEEDVIYDLQYAFGSRRSTRVSVR